MTEVMAESVSQPRLNTVLLGVFAGLAVLLATVGIYGVISYSVTRRTRELGVRMGLGADPRRVLAAVLREGAVLAAGGLAIGAVLAMLLTRFLRTMLFGVQPLDPVVFAGALAVLFAVALAAAFVPARRATRVDPLVALRYE